MSNEMNVEISEDNLTAKLSGGVIHLFADAMVQCFDGSGAINHLECEFEDKEKVESYVVLMQKKSGITQGEKIAIAEEQNAKLKEALNNLADKFEHTIATSHRNPMAWGAFRDAKQLLEE